MADVKGKYYYNDYNVTWGTYKYTVKCMNSAKTKAISDYDTAGFAIKTWLATPTITSITNETTGIKLVWKKSTNAQKYRVFRKVEGGSYKKLADTTALNYIDTSAVSGKTYYYKVRCITSNGSTCTSLMSGEKSIVRE